MNSENSKNSKPHLLIDNFIDKINLRRGKQSVALSNLSINHTWRNIKSSYKNNGFKIYAPTWNHKFELPDGSCYLSDIQDHFEYVLKNMEKRVMIICQ